MCVYILYMCVCKTYACMYVCVCMPVCMCAYVRVYVCVCVIMYVSSTYPYVCVCNKTHACWAAASCTPCV